MIKGQVVINCRIHSKALFGECMPCSLVASFLTLSMPGTLANSEDPDEMPHKVAFYQGLHCLLFKIKTINRDINTS